MFRVLFFLSMVLLTPLADAAEERVFEGPWNNRRTGSSGTMTCTATEVADGQWKAVFRGVFQGSPFEYQV